MLFAVSLRACARLSVACLILLLDKASPSKTNECLTNRVTGTPLSCTLTTRSNSCRVRQTLDIGTNRVRLDYTSIHEPRAWQDGSKSNRNASAFLNLSCDFPHAVHYDSGTVTVRRAPPMSRCPVEGAVPASCAPTRSGTHLHRCGCGRGPCCLFLKSHRLY